MRLIWTGKLVAGVVVGAVALGVGTVGSQVHSAEAAVTTTERTSETIGKVARSLAGAKTRWTYSATLRRTASLPETDRIRAEALRQASESNERTERERAQRQADAVRKQAERTAPPSTVRPAPAVPW